MKNFVFILICVACILATIYLGLTCYWATERDDSVWNIAVRVVGTMGWIMVTYRVISKKDRWIQKTFK